jgi:hypothetical protein
MVLCTERNVAVLVSAQMIYLGEQLTAGPANSGKHDWGRYCTPAYWHVDALESR